MKKITVLLVLSMLSGLLFSSCSQTASPADDSSDPSGQTTAPDNAGYLYYEGNDLGGTEISILNVAKICANMLCMINPDEMDGETINDAMYERNAFVMEKLNFTIAEDNRTTTAETMKVFEQAMLAQDDSYDIAYVPMNQSYKALTAGYFQNLRNIDSLHLSESWWDQTFLSATELTMLRGQVDSLGILPYFDRLLGLGNIQAFSKEEVGRRWKEENPSARILMVGDTDHDAQVAAAMGADCVLVTTGHQNRETLEKLPALFVADSAKAVLELIS